ncbi:D-lactate dehydrogenase [Marinihelvus fidelis]|uniref:D-lactate dehydrogenase n=1 Tax=Marinihelvus fidelis TaxID=2613842 RepID=UPI001CD609E6|nr:D-lactate dehydrogenase [Marinihelvus fidelis]
MADESQLIAALRDAVGRAHVATDSGRTEHFRKGFRSGEGAAAAVVFPQSLVGLWRALQCCVDAGAAIILQAANTGLTEGSTPSGDDYGRPVVVINTLALDGIHLVDQGRQVVALPGATLHRLQGLLQPLGRAPHSEIGSSCIGASIVGGIANNSGGALCHRGPAYTELALFARVDENGRLVLVNHTGIELGDDPETMLANLERGEFGAVGELPHPEDPARARMASDREYVKRLCDVDAGTASRFNADPRRLFEASGCAGKVAVFAVRLDTFAVPGRVKTFYLGSNDAAAFARLRRGLLTELPEPPVLGEYLHRDMFDLAARYGKDDFYVIEKLGTARLPKFFRAKGRVDAWLAKRRWLPRHLSDRVMQGFGRCLPNHLPRRMRDFRDRYEHHLVLKLADDNIDAGRAWLTRFFEQGENEGAIFECDDREAARAMLHRFVSAGAAIRYQRVNQGKVGELLALDIALPRNEMDWQEKLPPEISRQIMHRLYYGHFLCHVFHQDYILEPGADPVAVKKAMLAVLDARGARYPAEHNVGHVYEAAQAQKAFFAELDPTNTFNPGIGKTGKYPAAGVGGCGCR